jgi:hypothetical protein
MELVSVFIFFAPFLNDGLVPLNGNILIMLTGCVRFLPEAMQHINGLREFGQVHHPEPAIIKVDNDFSGPRANIIERLPAIRFQARLHLAKLMARFPAGVRSEDVIVLDVA